MVKRFTFVLVVAAISVLPGAAQRGGRGMPGGFGGFRGGGFFAGRAAGRGRGIAYFADPFLYTGYPTETFIETPPQFVAPQPAAVSAAPIQTNAEPLMIELQGNQYIRRANVSQQNQTSPTAYAASPTARQEQPRPVLIYADGHREEIPDYAIADGEVYIHGNYYQNGYWTRRIPLSALDLRATVEANQQRGVKFLLPSAPNVVVASF
jgi:hypothetical protein